jgi:hypothetical protein
MIITRFYIGADNKTGICDLQKIANIVAKTFKHATLIPCTGLWNGSLESSCIVEIASETMERYDAKLIARSWAAGLEQESIMVTVQDLGPYCYLVNSYMPKPKEGKS